MKNSHRAIPTPRSLILGLSISAALAAASVQAQDDSESEVELAVAATSEGLEVVVVTAEKRETDLQSTPVSITALDGQYLDDYGIDGIQEIGNRVAGLSFETVDRANPEVNIRGTDSGSTPGEDGGVTLFIDEVFYAGSDMGLDLFDIERIEVLRGPQGTLFGRNTTGGAINVVTKRPTENVTGDFQFTYGRWNQRILKGGISGPLADNVFGSVAVKTENTHGWVDNFTTGNAIADIDQWSLRSKLRYFSDTGMEANLTLSYMKDNSGGVAFFAMPGSRVPNLIPNTLVGETDKATNAFDGSTDREAYGATLRLEWDTSWLGNSTVTSITAWHTNDTVVVGPDQAATGARDVYILFSRTPEDTTFSQELRLSGQQGNLTWTAGLYYLDIVRFEVNRVRASWHAMSDVALLNANCEMFGLCPPGGAGSLLAPTDSPRQPFGFDTSGGADVDTNSFAGFGQIDWALNDISNLSVGLRWTRDEREGRSFTYDDYGIFNPFSWQTYDVSYDESWTALTPKVTYDINFVDWNGFDSFFIYASVARGYNAGGFAADTNPDAALRGYDPEYATNYEAGIKTRFWQNRAQFNLTGYQMDYTDLVTGVVTVNDAGFPFTAQQNAGKATIKGLEVDVVVLLTQNLTASMGYSWADAVYDELISGEDDLSGNRIEQTPEHSVNLDLMYSTTVGQGEMSWALNYAYRSEKTFGQDEAAEANIIPLTDYAKLNADLSYAVNNWRFSIWGKNLTNEQELNFQIGGALEGFVFNTQFGIDPQGSTYTTGGLAQPRSYGITVSRNWQ